MGARREVIVQASDEYRRASKKGKGLILDRVTATTGYNRDYASHLLCLFGRRLSLGGGRGASLNPQGGSSFWPRWNRSSPGRNSAPS